MLILKKYIVLIFLVKLYFYKLYKLLLDPQIHSSYIESISIQLKIFSATKQINII